MPRSNEGPTGRTLKGGRAYYRGQNAYASQGFENDQRQSQLSGLMFAYLVGTTTSGINNVFADVVLGAPVTVSSMSTALFLRGFYQDPATGIFYCRKTGTYKFFHSLRVSDLGPGEQFNSQMLVTRGVNEQRFFSAVTNTDAAASGSFLSAFTGYVDLRDGDILRFQTSTSGAVARTLQGMTQAVSAAGGTSDVFRPTYLSLEQVDLA